MSLSQIHPYVHSRHCRECKREYDRRYYQRHKTEIKEHVREWERNNPRRSAELKRRWYDKNKQQAFEAARRWKVNNPEKNRMSWHAYRMANPEKANVLRPSSQERVRNAISIPFTVEQLKHRLSMWGKRCWMCGTIASEMDHVLPIALGGPHCLSNIRPACKSCNSRKGARKVVA